MNNIDKKKIMFITIISILLIIACVGGFTYAYFSSIITGNDAATQTIGKASKLKLEYKDGNEAVLKNAVPGDSITKKFSVKNVGTAATSYTIYFSELSNKFADKSDLVYTLTSNDGGKGVKQTQVPNSNDVIASDCVIEVGQTHTYELTIKFLERNRPQDSNRNVSFITKISINETKDYIGTVNLLGKEINNTTQMANDDPDGNIRYFGADPNNYIYFNCSDYNNQNDSTCEKWRIIGIFKNVTKEDGTKEDLVKIVRADSIGNFSLDYKKKGVGSSVSDSGSNDWSDSQLMMMLNPTDYLKSGYSIENNIVKDSNGQEIYQNMGSYYNGTSGCKPVSIGSGESYNCTGVDFSSIGLKNDDTRNVIESVSWNLGASSRWQTIDKYYNSERGTTVYAGRPATWIGKIGLMYLSDYGYATKGDNRVTRSDCLNKGLSGWYVDNYKQDSCPKNDYLYMADTEQWMLNVSSQYSYELYDIYRSGQETNALAYSDRQVVRPTLYLKSDALLSDNGDGSKENPYQLKKYEPIVKSINIVSHIEALAQGSSQLTSDDPDGNIRYIGANPDNYVYLNCNDYSKQTSSTCEKWRIIGVFRMNTENAEDVKMIKVVRDDAIGNYSYDSTASNDNKGYGRNNWNNAALMKLLNPGYDALGVNNSLYWNAKSGKCYNAY